MTSSIWTPLREPIFRALWIAAIASNVGTWMQNVGGAWLMTSLTPSPLIVALMQTATSLPMFLVGLPAGAIADIVDRRRLLLFWEAWMLVSAAILGIFTLTGAVNAWLLLLLTFSIGLGTAMVAPAWQAIVPELVTRAELPTAVALNGISINAARAVGPALGGLVVAALGPGAVFVLNAVSFVGVLAVLFRWRRQPRPSALPTERLFGAMRAGLRYVRHAPILQAVFIRTAIFMSGASALWALLPVVARLELKLDATGYGALLGCMGVGAIFGGLALPKLRQSLSTNRMAILASLLFALATLALAYLRHPVLLGMMLMLAGLAWTTTMVSLNVSVQLAVPAWVQARSLGIYQLIFMGGMAIGSFIWGVVAEYVGISNALALAAVGLGLGLIAAMRYQLGAGERLDLSPSLHWGEPAVVIDLRPEDGPVLVTIEYRIDPTQADQFTVIMHDLRAVRRRDGAIRWGLFCDTADATRYLETFIVDSWAEHMRQHERFTNTDRNIESRARAFHVGDRPPEVSHLIYAR